MNILLAHFKIQDWGGIVNYSEFLARGFKELGHNVDALMLKNKGKSGVPKTKDRSLDEGWEYGPGLDLWMHQKTGWEGMRCFNYAADLDENEDWAEGYDLVIYIVPVPTCSKQNMNDCSWLRLFETTMVPQLSVIHDGNMQKLYPHILSTVEHLEGVICVHDAAYNSAEVLPTKRMFIPNPHDYDPLEEVLEPCDRDNAFVSMQTFKRWKRVDDLIRAIEHMDKDIEKIVCGGGIEYYYMTSDTKCKKEYMDEYGVRIWDKAAANGMEFLGYVDTEERDKILSRVLLLIDPSWSHTYSKLGSHFNRVMVEAMAKGCVPVCTDLGMKNSTLFKKNVNYIEIPHDASPEDYAWLIEEALGEVDTLSFIQANNLELMSTFDKAVIAQRIIDMDGLLNVTGQPTEKFISDCEKKLDYFGIL